MDSILRTPRDILAELSTESRVSPITNEQWTEADAIRRSQNNIAQWVQYLPEDCVRRMIEMRWDVTT